MVSKLILLAGAGVVSALLLGTGTGQRIQTVLSMLPGLFGAARKMWSLDIPSFDERHRELYARAVEDGNYSAVTMHYYSVMGDFLQNTIGEYWHFVPQVEGISYEKNFENFNQRLSIELKLAKGTTLCEIGCGLCRTGRDVARRAGAKFIGVTMSPREVEMGRAELETDGHLSWARIIQGDYKEMPLADGECDAVLAVYTLKYSTPGKTLTRALTEVARVLRTGGRFASYEILNSGAFDEGNATHREWSRRISYHTGMPPLASCRHYREEPPKLGLRLASEDNLEAHPKTTPNFASFPFSAVYPVDPYLFILNLVDDLGLKSGFRDFGEGFLQHPIVDFVESMSEGTLTTATLFIYEKEGR